MNAAVVVEDYRDAVYGSIQATLIASEELWLPQKKMAALAGEERRPGRQRPATAYGDEARDHADEYHRNALGQAEQRRPSELRT